jgi:hypothetical protein
VIAILAADEVTEKNLDKLPIVLIVIVVICLAIYFLGGGGSEK